MLILGMLGVFLCLFPTLSSATNTTTRADVHRNGSNENNNGLKRTLSSLPIIDILYDSETQMIEIVSSVDCEANIFVYDLSGNLIEYTESMDTVLSLPMGVSECFIRIEASTWYATALVGTECHGI